MKKKILVTGSAGHLGEALVRHLTSLGHDVVGIDIQESPYTGVVGSLVDADLVMRTMDGVQVVMHTATLHKPHIATHTRQQFVDTNITGTLNLLEAAVKHNIQSFVFTSTTSAFGDALTPPPGHPATWITEAVVPKPKNIYGITKLAAEGLCELFNRKFNLPCVILRTSRFFPEPDDNEQRRAQLSDANLKAIEFLYRRVEIDDVVSAHMLAAQRAPEIGFDRFIISATSPFEQSDLADLRTQPMSVLVRKLPGCEQLMAQLGWGLLPEIDRVYISQHATNRLGWQPKTTFMVALTRVAAGQDVLSPLARSIGIKGYHGAEYSDGLYPVS